MNGTWKDYVEVGLLDHVTECSFCGRACGFKADGGIVLHELPMCSTFKELDALEFVTAVRKAKGIIDPEENAS